MLKYVTFLGQPHPPHIQKYLTFLAIINFYIYDIVRRYRTIQYLRNFQELFLLLCGED